MELRLPPPLAPGDRIGVTAPSSGVRPALRARLDVAVRGLRDRGYDVLPGDCLVAEGHVSAPKEQRAAELQAMLTDPEIRAVVPPWGGEMAIDLLDLLDWEAISAAEPTWLVGFSDLCTVMLPLTLRTGWATLHGSNLMDTPYRPPEGLVHWLDVAGADGRVVQRSPGRHRSAGWDDYERQPAVDRHTLDTEGTWSTLSGEDASFSGRLLGGCIEVLSPLKGTPYGDLPGLAREHGPLVVYVEAAEENAFSIGRALHGMRHAGWFDDAAGVLVGRTAAPDCDGYTQRDAVEDALGDLEVPVVLDVECGHVAPYLPLVNTAVAHVDTARREITQELAR